MSQKSSLKMSFEVDTSEQVTQPEPQQQTVQVQKKVTRVDKEQHQAPQSGTVIQFEEKSYSSGRFGHIKDNMDAQKRYDLAFTGMAKRAARAGDQFDVERKLERRYDDDEKLGTPRRVLEWIVRVLQGQVPPPKGTDWQSVQAYLKDGVILCRVLNRLLIADKREPIRFTGKPKYTFAEINNVEKFVIGVQKYGVPKESLFTPADLHECRKGQMPNVFQCLNCLGVVANTRQFQPAYEETPVPKADWCKDECYE